MLASRIRTHQIPTESYVEEKDSGTWENAKKQFQLEYYIIQRLGSIPVDEAFEIWMESHEFYSVLWKKASKADVSGQPSTTRVKEGEISLRPQKGPKRVDTNVTCVKYAGSVTIHIRTYSNEWNSDQNTLSHMCRESIHDFGHSKERIPLMFAYSTDLEHSPQFVLLHQVSEKSRNFQTGC
ncbi:hypothetical protein ACS0TY_026727 [Phlomoides rotata]